MEDPTRILGNPVQTVLQWLKHILMGDCVERGD